MSESIFETFTDERGNISVRISQEVQVLTREEADRIAAEYRRMQAENAKLRKYVAWLEKWALDHASFGLSADVQFELDMARRELGIEVD